jgi:hypothetical protein
MLSGDTDKSGKQKRHRTRWTHSWLPVVRFVPVPLYESSLNPRYSGQDVPCLRVCLILLMAVMHVLVARMCPLSTV